MMTVVLRVCPLGKLGEVSNGGTASARGGRTRPISCLPTTVIASEPAAARVVRTAGDHDRQAQVASRTSATERIGIPTLPPMSVNVVRAWARAGVRCCTASSRTGWSSAATPSPSTTAS